MINFLHTNIPESIFIYLGSINIYYYGLLIVISIIIGLQLALYLASVYKISKELIIDSVFYLIIGGLLSARIFHIFLELPYYMNHPWQTLQIWQGGLAIHGGIIAGIIIIYLIAKKNKIDFWLLSSIYVPSLALAQSIGRWGNYFNQELYGLPTNKDWGIPIDFYHRVTGFESYEYFHPTFLYESIGNFLIFLILINLHFVFFRKNIKNYYLITLVYLVFYSILRFSLEFVRIDKTVEFFGLRLPQISSLIIILFCVIIFLALINKNKKVI